MPTLKKTKKAPAPSKKNNNKKPSKKTIGKGKPSGSTVSKKQPAQKQTKTPLKKITKAPFSQNSNKKKESTPVINKKNDHTIKSSKEKIAPPAKNNLAKSKNISTVTNPRSRLIESIKGIKPKAQKQEKGKPLMSKKKREVANTNSHKSVVKSMSTSEETKKIVLNARKRRKLSTPAFFKRKAKNTPIIFTLEDVKKIIVDRKSVSLENDEAKKKNSGKEVIKKYALKSSSTLNEISTSPQQARSLGAASILDILGFNPKEKTEIKAHHDASDKIPKKFLKYYHLLVNLRTHVLEELHLHTGETLKISSKDDTGNTSGYSQHLADAGTDTFDRDFALSLVSSEQEALNEIEDAIHRMLNNTYGICEITGKQISPERLDAVPFTRFSLEGQKEYEKTIKKPLTRTTGGVFSGETSVAEATHFSEDDI